MAYLRGSKVGNLLGTSIGNRGNFDWYSGEITTQSYLAQMTAPPAQPVFWSGLMWFGFILSLFAAIFVGIALGWINSIYPAWAKYSPFGKDPIYHANYITVGEIYLLIPPIVFISGVIIFSKIRSFSYQREKEILENERHNWEHSVICLRCGNTWFV